MTRHACGYCGCEIDEKGCACPPKPTLLELIEDYADWYADKGADHPATKEVHQKLVDQIKSQEETLLLFKQAYQLYIDVSLELRKKDDDLLRQVLSTMEGLFGIPDQWTGDGGGAVAVWRFGGVESVRAAIAVIKERLK